MKMTGIEVPFETLSKIEPNRVFVVIADDHGAVRVVKVDHSSMAAGEAFLKVTTNASGKQLGGCWVILNGTPVWKDPCPY